jgi:hypothetical protein
MFYNAHPRRVEQHLAKLQPSSRQFIENDLLRLCFMAGVPGVCRRSIASLKNAARHSAVLYRHLLSAARDEAEADDTSRDTDAMLDHFLQKCIGYGVQTVDFKTTRELRSYAIRGFDRKPTELKELCSEVRRECAESFR